MTKKETTKARMLRLAKDGRLWSSHRNGRQVTAVYRDGTTDSFKSASDGSASRLVHQLGRWHRQAQPALPLDDGLRAFPPPEQDAPPHAAS